MKKVYVKPDMQCISFYSEETIAELTEVLDNGVNAVISSVSLYDYDVDDWT